MYLSVLPSSDAWYSELIGEIERMEENRQWNTVSWTAGQWRCTTYCPSVMRRGVFRVMSVLFGELRTVIVTYLVQARLYVRGHNQEPV